MSVTKAVGKRVGQYSLRQKGRLVVLAPLLYQLVFVVLVVFVERQHTIEGRSVLDLTRAEAHLDALVARLHEAESAMRGYVLTGDASFALAFDESQRIFESEMDALDRYASPAAQAFESDAGRVFEYHRINRRLLASGNRDLAIARIRRLEGKRLMDSARRNADQIIQDERRLQLDLTRRSRRSRMMLLGVIGGGMALNVVVALLAGGFFGTSVTRRLEHVLENTRRLDRNDELIALEGGDEIAVLDREYRRVAHALQERTRRAEEINRELETFSYSVSHDLRAPLRAIGGYARLLDEDYKPRLDADGSHFVDVIRLEADRMGRLIDDLLDLSRTASRWLRYEKVDVAAHVRAEIQRLSVAEPDRDVEIAVVALPAVHGDAGMIGRVVANLVGNAWKYTRQRHSARIEVGGMVEEAMVHFFVKDNGAGFDMQYADKLFHVFERLHTSNEFEGTGVGLTLVERIVTRHGGRVWAEGVPGEGATFHFTLPAASENANVGDTA